MKKRNVFLFVLMAFVSFAVIGCSDTEIAMAQQRRMENEAKYTSESAVARSKLEVAEQNFKVFRRVVFYNVVTGEYALQIEGYCSVVVDDDGDIVVTVKTATGYLKHYLGKSNVFTYFSEAIQPQAITTDKYKVTFKPSMILPSVEIR